MSENSLVQRRNWFRVFPEGSIEFVVVTRVLALLLLLALTIVRGTQRPVVLLALAVVLWIDYLLTLWWAVQLATDLNALFADAPPRVEVLRRRRIRAAILGALPATAVLLVVAPWPERVPFIQLALAAMMHKLTPVLWVLFVLLLLPAQRALGRIRLGPPRWTLLLLIPVVHWFAVHRLLTHLHARLREPSPERSKPTSKGRGAGPAVIPADVTWILTLLSWAVVLTLILRGGQWPRNLPASIMPIWATVVAALFAVIDVAAMESVQRRFIALIGKGTTTGEN